MELLVQLCGVEEENMVTAALPEHDKISSLTLFAKVEYGAKNYSLCTPPVISTDYICAVSPKMKHSPPYPSPAQYSV